MNAFGIGEVYNFNTIVGYFTMGPVYALALVVTLLPVALTFSDPRLWIGTGSDVIHDEFIVTLKLRTTAQAAQGLANQVNSIGATVIREHQVGKRRFAHVRANPGLIHALLSNPHIDMIESNAMLHLHEPVENGVPVTNLPPIRRHRRSTGDRNNPHCHYDYPGIQGWGVIRTSHRDLPEDYETAPYIWGDGDDGEGVDVYIVDSGIRLNHTDFEGKKTYEIYLQQYYSNPILQYKKYINNKFHYNTKSLSTHRKCMLSVLIIKF